MKKTLIIIGSFGLLAASLAFAKVDKTALVAAKKAANAQVKCELVETNISRKIANFENNRDHHLASYTKTKDRMTALATKLESEGYDVAKLKADLALYDAKVTKFKDDYTLYFTALQQSQSFACGQSEGDFKTQLQVARTQLKVVHDDAVVIRTFWADVVKPDILALKAQKVTEKTEATTGGTE